MTNQCEDEGSSTKCSKRSSIIKVIMKFTILSITLCFLITLFGVHGRTTPTTPGMSGVSAGGEIVTYDAKSDFDHDASSMAATDSDQRDADAAVPLRDILPKWPNKWII
eukprot:CFRG2714T1